jgi:hypothetical protein
VRGGCVFLSHTCTLSFHYSSYAEFAFCSSEDQRSYQRYAVEFPNKISIDKQNHIFLCVHAGQWRVQVEVLMSKKPPMSTTASRMMDDSIGNKDERILIPVFRNLKRPNYDQHRFLRDDDDDDVNKEYRPLVLHFNSADGKKMMPAMLHALMV